MTRTGLAAAVVAVVMAASSVIVWQQPELTGITGPEASESANDGAMLFRTKGCSSCHTGPDSIAPTGSTFPSSAAASSWAGKRRPGMSAEDYLAESIRTPPAFRSPEFSSLGGPTLAMPDLGLSDVEIEAVVAYLSSS